MIIHTASDTRKTIRKTTYILSPDLKIPDFNQIYRSTYRRGCKASPDIKKLGVVGNDDKSRVGNDFSVSGGEKRRKARRTDEKKREGGRGRTGTRTRRDVARHLKRFH